MSTSGGHGEYPRIDASNALYARALSLIPAGTQTLAKGPTQYVRGVSPKYLRRGKGCRVWDVDGNEYVDLTMGVGPISLGYAYPRVDQAIREQLAEGITFSLMHPLEVEVAELIREMVPGAEMVRFSKTGCDVTSAAVRLARASTGRDRVLCCGYHGWHDWYVSVMDRNAGVPEAVRGLTSTFEYNDLSAFLDVIGDDVACVILEPTVFEAPAPGFLQGIREACDRHGTVLIFDEMWTGFRLAIGGAQERFGITADLACFSKAVANGMPLSVLTGRRDLMRLLDREVFFFTTFGGEALSLAAARATLLELREKSVPAYLEEKGRKLQAEIGAITRSFDMPYVKCMGHGARSLVTIGATGEDPLVIKSLIQQEMIRAGVLWSGFHNLCFSHTDEDLALVLDAYRHALAFVRDAVTSGTVRASLRGEPIEPTVRKAFGFHTKPKPPQTNGRAPEER